MGLAERELSTGLQRTAGMLDHPHCPAHLHAVNQIIWRLLEASKQHNSPQCEAQPRDLSNSMCQCSDDYAVLAQSTDMLNIAKAQIRTGSCDTNNQDADLKCICLHCISGVTYRAAAMHFQVYGLGKYLGKSCRPSQAQSRDEVCLP